MAFLRRLIGGRGPDAGVDVRPDPVELDALEREHELEVLRGEQQRLDELQQRQLRYERYAWQPPAQGGDRRAEDEDQPADS